MPFLLFIWTIKQIQIDISVPGKNSTIWVQFFLETFRAADTYYADIRSKPLCPPTLPIKKKLIGNILVNTRKLTILIVQENADWRKIWEFFKSFGKVNISMKFTYVDSTLSSFFKGTNSGLKTNIYYDIDNWISTFWTGADASRNFFCWINFKFN